MHTTSFTTPTCAFSSFYSKSVFFFGIFLRFTCDMDDLIEILAVLLVKEPGSSNHAGRTVIGFDMKLVHELASFLSKEIRPWQHSLSDLPVQDFLLSYL